jgi:DNA adenine methylase
MRQTLTRVDTKRWSEPVALKLFNNTARTDQLKSTESASMMADMARRVINVSAVPHRSPFRYPGGKTWLVPYVRQWLNSRDKKPSDFIEPFAGGGIVSLSVLFDDLSSHITVIERDENVASVWNAILSQGNELAAKIVDFDLSKDKVISTLAAGPDTVLDLAFQTILRNRVQRGGIMAPGAGLLKYGENGNGIASRWYPQTLSKRITDIVNKASCIEFIEGDGIAYVNANATRDNVLWFIDPPYTVAGRRLYRYSEIDHRALFTAMSKVKGDFLMTYDDAAPIHELAGEFNLDIHKIPMKSTHHTLKYELLIGRDVGWARKPLQFGKNASLELLKTHGHAGG